jgi:hypothetical protein
MLQQPWSLPVFSNPDIPIRYAALHENRKVKRNRNCLTVPGGKIASNLSTPNMPRFERVNVPADWTWTAVSIHK